MGSDPQTDILVSHGTANLWIKLPPLLHQPCSPSASGPPVPRLKPEGSSQHCSHQTTLSTIRGHRGINFYPSPGSDWLMEVAGVSDAARVQVVVQLAGQWAKQTHWALGTDADVLPSHIVIISACGTDR